MFVVLKRFNQKNELKECVVNTDMIIGITETNDSDINLYDENGNFVETKTVERRFEIALKGGIRTVVSEDTYNNLLDKLTK